MNKEQFNTEDEYIGIAEQLVSVRLNGICGLTVKEFPNNGPLYEIVDRVAEALAVEDKKEVHYWLNKITHSFLLKLLKEIR
jgi:hypothetical protein